jgi:hypothetical protein
MKRLTFITLGLAAVARADTRQKRIKAAIIDYFTTVVDQTYPGSFATVNTPQTMTIDGDFNIDKLAEYVAKRL